MKAIRVSRIFAVSVAFAFCLSFFPPDVFSRGGGSSGGGGHSSSSGGSHSSSGSSSRSYSTPSRPSSSPAPSRSFSTPSTPKNPSSPLSSPAPSRQYSAPGKPDSRVVVPKSEARRGVDSGAIKAGKQQESKAKYDAANPRIQTSSQKQSYSDLKRELNSTKMENRQLRQQQTFGGYYGHPAPTVVYHDGFNIWFWLWLMDRPMHDRDTWLYNHKDQMDPVRYEEMKQKDKELEARLKVLETQGVQKDPSYIPPGVERDLMYSDEYVKSAYVEKTKSGFPWIWVFVSLLVVTGMAYFVFIRKWNNGI